MKQVVIIFLFINTITGFSQSVFQQVPDPARYPERGSTIPIEATIPYQGYEETSALLGQGEYEIFLDNVNGILDQPILLLDGFDPGDTRGIGALYASLSFGNENLADILRDEGYDIIVLNAPQYTTEGQTIDGGSDYIQRNAFVLIALIQEINDAKQGDEDLVIIGPSMGGLIARYGLAYMQANSLEHDTRLFISIDSPHRGANIPISLQYLINYFGDEIGDETAQGILNNVLGSPAAKEMLVDHLLGHLAEGSTSQQDPSLLLPLGAPNFRDAFQNELDDLGFATDVRNVTIVNGNDLGITTGSPGMSIIETNIPVNEVSSIDIALNFTPPASLINTATEVTTFLLGIPVGGFDALAESPAETDGVDASPGGTSNISGALGGGATGNPILDDFIAAIEQDTYSFIPTMSGLAIDNPDWYATPNLGDSPFVNFFIPEVNEPHVTITEASAQFALDEIRQLLAVDSNALSLSISLLQNPIKTSINLQLTDGINEKVALQLFTTTGQLIATKTIQQPGTLIQWEQNLPTGIYLLKVSQADKEATLKVVAQ